METQQNNPNAQYRTSRQVKRKQVKTAQMQEGVFFRLGYKLQGI